MSDQPSANSRGQRSWPAGARPRPSIPTASCRPRFFSSRCRSRGSSIICSRDDRKGRSRTRVSTIPGTTGHRFWSSTRTSAAARRASTRPQGLVRAGLSRRIVGESFSEIFQGNSAMLGMPCFVASHEDIDRLQSLVERTPDTVIAADVASGTITAGGLRIAAVLPAALRDGVFCRDNGIRRRCCSTSSTRSRARRGPAAVRPGGVLERFAYRP